MRNAADFSEELVGQYGHVRLFQPRCGEYVYHLVGGHRLGDYLAHRVVELFV